MRGEGDSGISSTSRLDSEIHFGLIEVGNTLRGKSRDFVPVLGEYCFGTWSLHASSNNSLIRISRLISACSTCFSSTRTRIRSMLLSAVNYGGGDNGSM